MQTEKISFRASPNIAEALEARAENAGCSLSEYLRAVVREKIGIQ